MGHRANTARWLRRHLSRTLVGELHSRGLAVAAWTVNDPRGARRLAGMGVDVIVTDAPCEIAEALAAR